MHLKMGRVSLILAATAFTLQEDVAGARYDSMRTPENCVYPFEIVFLQDATASFEEMFARMARDELTTLFAALDRSEEYVNLDGSDADQIDPSTTEFAPELSGNYYGLISFKDKPIWPLGNAPTSENTYSDYCARVETDLSRNRQAIIGWYNETEPMGGGDPNENQLGGLFTAAASHEVSWNTDNAASRLVVLITDSSPHFENDQFVLNVTSHQFSNFTGVYDQQYPDEQCVKENYPTAEGVMNLLHQKNIKVAFLIHDDSESQAVMESWRWFNSDVLQQADFYLVDLMRDGSQFATKLQQIIQTQRDSECNLNEEETTDPTVDIDGAAEDPTQQSTDQEVTDEVTDQVTSDMTEEVTSEDVTSEDVSADITSDFAGMADSSTEMDLLTDESTEDDEECDLLPTGTTAVDLSSSLVMCLSEANVTFLDPSSHKYFAATIPYNLHFPQTSPAAIVYAHSESDVQAAVNCGVAEGIPIVPRSGGHDYSSYSYGQDGDLVIDLKYMDYLELASDGHAKMGPGIRAGTLYYKAFTEANRMFPGGACTEIGLGGHLLGGGYGFFSRAYGLATDLVKSLRMVDYNGDVVVANRTHNNDLYWALCGGGNGNFGVVTEIEMDLIEAPPVVTSASLVFEAADFEKVLIGMLNLTDQAPRHLGISLAADSTVVALQAAYIGTEDEMKSFLEPYFANIANFYSTYREGDFLTSVSELSITYMLDTRSIVGIPLVIDDAEAVANATDAINNATTSSRKVVATSELNLPADYEPVKTYFKCHSLLWTDRHPMNRQAIDAMTAYFNTALTEYPTFGIAFEMFGGNNSAIRTRQYNSWPWRDAHWITHFYSRGVSLLPQADLEFIAQMKRSLRASGAHAVYVNYHDDDLKSPLTDYYGANLSRLKAIKTKYDPQGAFWYPQVIPPNQEDDTTDEVEANDVTTALTDFVPTLPPTTVPAVTVPLPTTANNSTASR